jgi:hypothetical protein
VSLRNIHIASVALAAMAMSSAGALGGAVQETYTLTRDAASPFVPLRSSGNGYVNGGSSGRRISPPGRKPAGLIRQQIKARRQRDS